MTKTNAKPVIDAPTMTDDEIFDLIRSGGLALRPLVDLNEGNAIDKLEGGV